LTDLIWPHLIVSSVVFQVIFFQLIYNSAQFFGSYFSFLLHIIASFICSCIDSGAKVLKSLLHTLSGQN